MQLHLYRFVNECMRLCVCVCVCVHEHEHAGVPWGLGIDARMFYVSVSLK